MSDTPKYTYWYLSDEEQERLAKAQREEERQRKERQFEEAARRREERIARSRSALTEQNAELFRLLKRLSETLQSANFPGMEQIDVLRNGLEPLQNSIDAIRWDDELQSVSRILRKQKHSVDGLYAFLNEKNNILKGLRKIEDGIAARKNLTISSTVWGTVEQRGLFAQSVREAETPEGLFLLKNTWNLIFEFFEKLFLLYDEREGCARLSAGMAALDRQLVSGENLKLYQQISTEITKLETFLKSEDASSASAILLRAKNHLEILTLKMRNDAAALAQRHDENAARLSALSDAFEEISNDSLNFSLNSMFPLTDLSNVENRIRTSLQRLEPLCAQEETADFTASVDGVRKEIEEFRTSTQQAQKIADFQTSLIQRLPASLWEELAADDFHEIEKMTENLKKQLQNRQSVRFDASFEKLTRFTESVIERLTSAITARNEKIAQIQKVLNQTRDFIESYSSDPAAQRWARTEIESQSNILKSIENSLPNKNLTEIENALSRWQSQMEQITQAVNLMEEKELRRQFLVQRFQEKFKELGFSSSVPHWEDSSNPASGILLTASRPEGKTINVRFDQDEHQPVMYAVDGFPMPTQRVDGKAYRTCDEAQRQLEILHKLLKKHGILMEKLSWEDQPPVDLEKEALELPDAADREIHEN